MEGKSKKFTVEDSQNSLIIHINEAHQLEEKLNAIYGKKIQPLIICQGLSIYDFKEIFVYFDNIKYKSENFISALDTCFKIINLFNLNYPIQSKNVWLFIQYYFYNIKFLNDNFNSAITTMKKQLESKKM